MTTARYVVLAILVVAMLGANALAGNTPSEVFGARRAAAIAAKHPKVGNDPLVNGTSSTPIGPATTEYFNAISTAAEIPDNCKAVEVSQVSGNAFDPNNLGVLELHGLDVGIVFLDITATPIAINGITSGISPNSNLFVAGYSTASPQQVEYVVKDFTDAGLPAPESVAVIVEGDVTNSDTAAHPVDAAVTGLINFENCK